MITRVTNKKLKTKNNYKERSIKDIFYSINNKHFHVLTFNLKVREQKLLITKKPHSP